MGYVLPHSLSQPIIFFCHKYISVTINIYSDGVLRNSANGVNNLNRN